MPPAHTSRLSIITAVVVHCKPRKTWVAAPFRLCRDNIPRPYDYCLVSLNTPQTIFLAAVLLPQLQRGRYAKQRSHLSKSAGFGALRNDPVALELTQGVTKTQIKHH